MTTKDKYMLYLCIKEGHTSISRGRELLGFEHMNDMRDWMYHLDIALKDDTKDIAPDVEIVK
jgi:hypothetical protein